MNLGNSQFIELCLQDLDSSSSIVRMAAYTQLGNYLNIPRVQEKIRQKLKVEKDLECRKLLDSLENYLQKTSAAKTPSSEKLQTKNQDFKEIQDRVLTLLSLSDSSVEDLIWVLGQKKELLEQPKIISALTPLLQHSNSLIVAKTFTVLSTISPGKVVFSIPKLLKHSNPLIRITAINFLFRIKPGEALRLLGNLINTTDYRYNNLSLTFMYTLPFQDVWPFLLKLIEKGNLEQNTFQLILGLVSTNPDIKFYKKLEYFYLTKGCENPKLQELKSAQLTALEVTETISETAKDFAQQTKKEILSRVSSIVGKDTELGKESNKNDQKLAKNYKDSVISEPKNDLNKTEEKTDDSETITIDQILAKISDLLAKPELSLDEKNWLVAQLDHENSGVKIQAMNCLFDKVKKDLMIHLPVLCQNDDFFVASQAIRLFVKFEGKGFANRLNGWLNSKSPKEFNSALTALTQQDLQSTLPMILKFLEKSSNLERIKRLTNILLINPDFSIVTELKRITYRVENSAKKALLIKTCKNIQNQLKISGLTETSSKNNLKKLLEDTELRDKWEDILIKIENVRYSIDEQSSNFSLKHFITILVVLQIILFSYFYLFDTTKSTTGHAQRKQRTVCLKPEKDQIITGVFVEFDAFNKWWLIETSEGKHYKVIISKNSQSIETGQSFRGIVKASKYSSSGYPLITLRKLELK